MLAKWHVNVAPRKSHGKRDPIVTFGAPKPKMTGLS